MKGRNIQEKVSAYIYNVELKGKVRCKSGEVLPL